MNSKSCLEDKIKSLEFDSVSNEICVFTKFQKGFYITKQGNHSCQRFLFHPKERVSDQQARDSMVSCIDRYARFVPARFFSDEWTILAKWISRRVVYPPALLKDGVQGCVWLQFVIGADGRLKDYQIEESPHILFSIAVLKVVERLPAWIPATYDGEPVESNYRLPIIFKLYGSLLILISSVPGRATESSSIPYRMHPTAGNFPQLFISFHFPNFFCLRSFCRLPMSGMSKKWTK